MDSLATIVADPAYHDYLAIVKGVRNGIVYGTKVRFPHALVMAILFGKGSWKDRAWSILRATKQHALNLAKFTTLYKVLLLLQKRLNNGKPRSMDTFVAGLISGYMVFGERNAINEQIVLYVCARVVASFIPRAGSPSSTAGQPTRPIPPDAKKFSIFAALSWGAVMWLFNNRGEAIQPGMFNSMTYLYHDSEHWDSLRTLLWHNK